MTSQAAPRYIRYCTRCVMPETKPDLFFDDEGVCSACRSLRAARRGRLGRAPRPSSTRSSTATARRTARNYDCIVPVSGGKDSTYQVDPHARARAEPAVRHRDHRRALRHRPAQHREPQAPRRRLRRGHAEPGRAPPASTASALTEVGDISWPEHVGDLHDPGARRRCSSASRCIVWGENSQNEYGGPAAAAENNVLDPPLARGVRRPARPARLRPRRPGRASSRKHLIQYTYPTDEELAARRRDRHLPRLLPAVGRLQNALYRAGPRLRDAADRPVEGSLVNYENLDNHQTGIHDYFKFLKFGFGRATDLACLHVRRGRLTRERRARRSCSGTTASSRGPTSASRSRTILERAST